MKLSDLTPAHVKQAVSIFVEHAWPGGPPGRAAELTVAVDGASTMEDLAEIFELVRTGEGEGRRRFSLRLGNDRYPWMKLVVQEFLVSGEFFISADTHDDIRIDPTMQRRTQGSGRGPLGARGAADAQRSPRALRGHGSLGGGGAQGDRWAQAPHRRR